MSDKTESTAIYLATDPEHIAESFHLIKQLRLHLTDVGAYVGQVQRQQADGYHLLLLKVDGELISAAGFRIHECLAWGRLLYIDDLITDEAARKRGGAGRLFRWLIEYARDHGCAQLHLDSGFQRYDAHRFYLNQKMRISCHHFEMRLDAAD